MPKRPAPAQDKLEAIGEDAVIDRLMQGDTESSLARELGISQPVVSRWLDAEPNRSARARDARAKSAHALAAKAREVLEAIPDDASQAAIARAREVASHLRWEAKVRMPQVYSDRVQLDATVSVKAMDTDALMAQAKALGAKLGLAPPSADGD